MASKGRSTPLANGLTPKMERFKQELIKDIRKNKTPNATEAALKIYDTSSRSVAGTIAAENMQKPAIRLSIQEELNKIGLSREKLMENIGNIADRGIKEDQKVSPETILKSNLELLKLITPKNGSLDHHGNTYNFINLGYDEAKKQLTKLDAENAEFIDDADS